jgi:hypothetical protein
MAELPKDIDPYGVLGLFCSGWLRYRSEKERGVCL